MDKLEQKGMIKKRQGTQKTLGMISQLFSQTHKKLWM